MTPKLLLVTGGSRSGKSRYAQQRAEAFSGSRLYVATAPVIDREMEQRIRKHQKERKHRHWKTLEAPVELASALESAHQETVVLVDCLTLWVNNLMYEAEQRGTELSEAAIKRRCQELLNACKDHPATIIFVTNETGMGIVPENKISRRFRDLAGRVNQLVAAACDEVVLVVCGQPLTIKPAKL